METQQLQDVMRYQLGNFNDEGVEITDDTVHSEVLSMTDGFEGDHSATVYPKLVKWTLHNNGDQVKEWPADWLNQSVKQLAAALIMLLLFISTSFSQEKVKVSLSAVKTDLKHNALDFGISYLPALNLNYDGHESILYGKKSVFSLTPNIDMQAGNSDAFSSITAKLTGMAVFFGTTTVSGIVTPNTSKVIHTLPVSLGVETNSQFNFINTLLEVGYVPWYQGASNPDWIKHTKLGVFLQAGYKARIDSSGNISTGGQVDESQEALNSGLFRVKGSFAVDTKQLVSIQSVKLGLVGSSDVWFDFVNSATYYRLIGALRVYLNGANYLDLQFQRGSGAPNFNQGDQWGVGLTLLF